MNQSECVNKLRELADWLDSAGDIRGNYNIDVNCHRVGDEQSFRNVVRGASKSSMSQHDESSYFVVIRRFGKDVELVVYGTNGFFLGETTEVVQEIRRVSSRTIHDLMKEDNR